MTVDTKLRADLIRRLGISDRQLRRRAQARRLELPMSPEEAIYTIAAESGLDLSKYLSNDETAQIRRLVSDLRGLSATAPKNGTTAVISPRKEAAPKAVTVMIAGVKIGDLPGLKPSHATEAKVMAEKVYPTLYIFENSVRDIIERVLRAVFGPDWWTKAVPPKVRQKAEAHKAGEKSDPWHGRRGNRELDYLLLTQLWDIIKHQWKHFDALFPDQAWVQTIITRDMNVSRRVLAHMNPLSTDDISNIENAFRKWAKQLQAVEALLP